jgi:hypothetical protein
MQTLEEPPAQPVGRILSWSDEGKGKCDLSVEVQEGDIVSYMDPLRRTGICRVEQVNNIGPVGGMRGMIRLIGSRTSVPPSMTALYRYEPPKVKGALVELGNNQDEQAMKVRVNSLFQHSMFAGKTGTGKTNFAISTAEELLTLRVPNLILDPQGEFSNLKDLGEFVRVTSDPSDVLDSLRERMTVVLNLLDLADTEKVKAFSAAVSALIREKEAAYKSNAKNNSFPPVIVTVDEAEIFAPESTWFKEQQASRAILTDLVKRRSKFGIGAILLIQRFANFCTEIRSQCRNVAAFGMTESGDLQSLSAFVGQKLRKDELQSLKEGECVLAGGWVDYPVTIKTRKIQTTRTKSLDFESLLDLDSKEYKGPLPIVPHRSVSREDEDATHVCSDCRAKCQTIVDKGHTGVSFSHAHYVCPKCLDEFCVVLERWVQTNARSKAKKW